MVSALPILQEVPHEGAPVGSVALLLRMELLKVDTKVDDKICQGYVDLARPQIPPAGVEIGPSPLHWGGEWQAGEGHIGDRSSDRAHNTLILLGSQGTKCPVIGTLAALWPVSARLWPLHSSLSNPPCIHFFLVALRWHPEPRHRPACRAQPTRASQCVRLDARIAPDA